MIVSFGASWPMNVIKSYKARTAKGKSLAFLLLILFGYVAGITSKLINEAYMSSFSQKWYVLFFYVLMLFYSIRQGRKEGTDIAAEGDEDAQNVKSMPTWRIPVWILGGLGMLIYGGQLCVDSATEIARNLGVSEATIAITLVAGGTSLPELAASLVSLIKGRGGLALGNVLGSNIANILLILGASSLITPLSMGNITMIDIAVAVSAPVLVLLSGLFIGDKRITRFEGIIFLLIFAGYIYTLI